MTGLVGSARAGNLDTYYLSGEAALQGGAITADTRHGGAIWYNPAGLADVNSSRLDGSVSAYALHLGERPDVSASSANSQATRLRTIDFRIVPAAVSYVRRWGKVTVGFGVFAPVLEPLYLRTQVKGQLGDTGAFSSTASEVGIDVYSRTQDYYAGPSLGMALSPNVSVGGSLFAHYRNSIAVGDSYFSYTRDTSSLGSTSHTTLDWQQLGLQALLGLQVSPDRDWNFGFAIRFPSLRIYQVKQVVTLETLGVTGDAGKGAYTQGSKFSDASGFSNGVMFPARFHAGVSRRFGRGRVAFELNYTEPLRRPDLDIDWKPTVNARIGAKYGIDEELTIGGGVFTDNSPQRRIRSFGDVRLNYYGATVCLDTAKFFEVSATKPERNSTGSRLRFGTTFAVTYAVGIGDMVGATVGFANGPELTEAQRSTVSHEILIQLASSLSM
jgi:hypothetical protein